MLLTHKLLLAEFPFAYPPADIGTGATSWKCRDRLGRGLYGYNPFWSHRPRVENESMDVRT